MGSDLYMEAASWRPRPNKVYWKDDGNESFTLVIEKDHFYHGYSVIFDDYVDEDNKTVMTLLRALGVSKLPEQPEPVVPKREQVRRALRNYYDYCDPEILDKVMEIVNAD